MSVNTVAHVNFRGNAREALTFWQSAVGGSLAVVTYRDLGAAQVDAEADQVMWGQVEAPSGFRIMAFDVPGAREFDRGTESFFVALRGDDVDEITAIWNGLAEGAMIRTPFGPSAWSPLYGMLTDRFGITWVIDVAVEHAG